MLLFNHREIIKFFLMVVFGLSFSIAVILSIIGIMDGFIDVLKDGLKRSNGDLTMTNERGFFYLDDHINQNFQNLKVESWSGYIQTESFIVNPKNSASHGVIIRGIESKNYSKIVGMNFQLATNAQASNKGIAIGHELQKSLSANIGDEVSLILAKSGERGESIPQVVTRTIVQIINHGIYQKDLRIVYLPLNDLREVLGIHEKVNYVLLNVPNSNQAHKKTKSDDIQKFLNQLESVFHESYFFKPYWREFSSLIEAVHIEKLLIGVILQAVVLISIFNVLAFIVYVNERRSKDFFLLQALGLSKNKLLKIWLIFLILLWALSCLCSLGFVELFRFFIVNLSVIKLPPEIYFIGAFKISIQWHEYLLVFLAALIWVFVFSFFILKKMQKKNLIDGLRKEFH